MPRVTSMIEDAMTNNLSVESSSYQRQTANYEKLLEAFAVLLQREDDVLIDVFPTEFQLNVFNKLIELPLTYMKEKAEAICQAIEKSPHKLDPTQSVIDRLIGILKWFLQSMSKYPKLYQVTSRPMNSIDRVAFHSLSVTVPSGSRWKPSKPIDDTFDDLPKIGSSPRTLVDRREK